MALKAPPPESFGIRRKLTISSQAPLLELFTELQQDGSIPENVEMRRSMHVTISPKRHLDNQLQRGIVAGYELGRALPATKREISEEAPQDLVAILGKVTVLKGHIVVFRVESEELERETRHAQIALARIGLKGMLREQPPVHSTIGDSGPLLSLDNQTRIEEVLNDTMPIGREIALHDLEFYTSGSKAA